MIAGLEEISQRDAEASATRSSTSCLPRDRDVAMVFQSYALYPHMTVRDNISFGLKLRKMPKAEIETRVQDAARILGLTDLLDRKPKQLSGGQRQRVAMGRSIVRQPAVFLFDEPLSNLDAKLRVQMRAEIAQLHRRLGTTTVYVTHDQVEAMTLAKHIVVMNKGVVQQVGEPLELYRDPVEYFCGRLYRQPVDELLFDVTRQRRPEWLSRRAEACGVRCPSRLQAVSRQGRAPGAGAGHSSRTYVRGEGRGRHGGHVERSMFSSRSGPRSTRWGGSKEQSVDRHARP